MTKKKAAPAPKTTTAKKRPVKPSAEPAPEPTPEFPFKLAATGNTVTFYNADGTPRTAEPLARVNDRPWTAFERAGDLLRVTRFAVTGEGGDELWVKAADVVRAE